MPYNLCRLVFSTNQKRAKQESTNKIIFGSAFKRELRP